MTGYGHRYVLVLLARSRHQHVFFLLSPNRVLNVHQGAGFKGWWIKMTLTCWRRLRRSGASWTRSMTRPKVQSGRPNRPTTTWGRDSFWILVSVFTYRKLCFSCRNKLIPLNIKKCIDCFLDWFTRWQQQVLLFGRQSKKQSHWDDTKDRNSAEDLECPEGPRQGPGHRNAETRGETALGP